MAIARYRAFHVAAARAIGRNLRGDAHEFPEDVVKLMGYFRPAEGDIPTGADQTRVHTESFVLTATVNLSRSIAASAAGQSGTALTKLPPSPMNEGRREIVGLHSSIGSVGSV